MKSGLKVAAVSALALGAMAGTLAAAELGKTYEEILAGAKEEGALVVWSNLPAQAASHQALIDAFNERFGLDTKLEWVPLSSPAANARVIAESAGRDVTVDLIGSGSIGEIIVARDAEIIKPYDWTGVFGAEMPEIKDVAAPTEFDGLGLSYFVAHSVMGWNPDQIEGAEVPDSWEGVTDPKWKDRFSANAYFLWPLEVVSLCIGEEAALEMADGLLANRPVLGKGSPTVNQAITTGQVPIGFTLSLVAEGSVRKGEPLEFKMFNDYLPSWDNYLWVLENSPNPNTARLFGAWMATEGYKVVDPIEPLPSKLDKDNVFTKMTQTQVDEKGAKRCTIETSQDVEQMARVREAVVLKMSGQN